MLNRAIEHAIERAVDLYSSDALSLGPVVVSHVRSARLQLKCLGTLQVEGPTQSILGSVEASLMSYGKLQVSAGGSKLHKRGIETWLLLKDVSHENTTFRGSRGSVAKVLSELETLWEAPGVCSAFQNCIKDQA